MSSRVSAKINFVIWKIKEVLCIYGWNDLIMHPKRFELNAATSEGRNNNEM